MGTSLHVISHICQLVAQELDKTHILYARKFCRPTSGLLSWRKVVLG